MRRTAILVALVLTSAGVVTAQVPDEVRSLIQQGIAKHDQKDYDGAIRPANEARGGMRARSDRFRPLRITIRQ